MFHKNIPRDGRGCVRPDLRAQAIRDWESVPLDEGYIWRSIGPERGLDPGGPRTAQSPPLAGGLVSDFALGTDPRHVIIGTRGGGVWRSTDGGTTWTPTGDRLPSLQTVTVAMVERQAVPPILFAATGDLGNERIRNTGLFGLYRSVDGGKTWSVVDGGFDATVFRSHDANQIVALDDQRIFLATRVGLYFSKDGGRNFGDDSDHRNGRPVLRGHVTVVVVQGTEVTAALSGEPSGVPDPVPPNLLWQTTSVAAKQPGIYTAALTSTAVGAFTQVHRTRALVGDDRVGNTAFDRRDRFFLLSAARREIPRRTESDSNRERRFFPHHSIQFTRDATGRARWHRLDSRLVRPLQDFYCHVVAMETQRAGRAAPDAWFGSLGLFRQEIRGASNGAFSWSGGQRGTDDTGRTSGTVHLDQHVIQVVQPSQGALDVFVGNDGGFYRTSDGGDSWTSFNNHGSIMFWTLAGARTDDSTTLRLIGGLQDNYTVVGEGPMNPTAADSATSWLWQNIVAGGDGGNLAFIPRDANREPVQNPLSALITGTGILFRATRDPRDGVWKAPRDRPEFFNRTRPRPRAFSETVAVARGPSGNWDRMYFAASNRGTGANRLHRRDDGRAFAHIRNFTEMVSALAAAPADASTERSDGIPGEWNHLWVGLVNGEVWFSDNAGSSFVPQPVGGRTAPVTGIAVDPQDSRRVAVVYGGFSEPGRLEATRHVFLTEDGATFRDISGRPGRDGWVPDMPILSVAFTHTDPVALLIGTDMGVLYTKGPELGERWWRLGVGLPRIQCPGVTAVNEPLSHATPVLDATHGLPPIAVGTFGRGAYLLVRPSRGEPFVDFDGGFGALRVGTRYERKLVIHNPGGTPITFAAGSPSVPFSYLAVPGNGSIPARGHVEWTVVCEPTAAGIATADLPITIEGSARPVAVSCEAVTDGPPRLAFWPRIVNLGPVPPGDTAEATINLINTGQSDLAITGVSVGPLIPSAPAPGAPPPSAPPPPSAALTLTPTTLTLAPGQEGTMTLRFAGATNRSHHEAAFTLVCNDPVAAAAGTTNHFTLVASTDVQSPTPGSGNNWIWYALGAGALAGGAV